MIPNEMTFKKNHMCPDDFLKRKRLRLFAQKKHPVNQP
jgi:hypothetical protein